LLTECDLNMCTLVYKESYVRDEDDRTPPSWKQFAPVYSSHPLTFAGFSLNNFGTSCLTIIPSSVLYVHTHVSAHWQRPDTGWYYYIYQTLCACVCVFQVSINVHICHATPRMHALSRVNSIIILYVFISISKMHLLFLLQNDGIT